MAEARTGKGGFIFGGIVMMLFGAFLLYTAYDIAHETGSCAGETMRAGDRCEHVGRGTLRTNSVDEEKSEKHSSAWGNAGIGMVFVLLGGGIIYLGLRPPTPVGAQDSSRTSTAPGPTTSHTGRDEALGALARGEVVTFGELSLGPNGIRTRKGELAWTEIENAKLDGPQIIINKRGKLVPIVLTPKKVPQGRLAVDLIEHMRTSLAATALGPDAHRALDALERGEVLTFGTLTLDRNGLRTPEGDLAWSQIRTIKLDRNDIAIFPHGKWVPILVPQADVPQHTLVAGLADHLMSRLP